MVRRAGKGPGADAQRIPSEHGALEWRTARPRSTVHTQAHVLFRPARGAPGQERGRITTAREVGRGTGQ